MPVIIGIVKLIVMESAGLTPTDPAAGISLDNAGAPATDALATSAGDIALFAQAVIASAVAKALMDREMVGIGS